MGKKNKGHVFITRCYVIKRGEAVLVETRAAFTKNQYHALKNRWPLCTVEAIAITI